MSGIPSGNGTEVLKHTRILNLSNADQALITGVANHIYTVVSVIFTEASDNTENIYMKVTDSSGNNAGYIFYNQAITGYSTFVWNDKFSFQGDLQLEVASLASANIHVHCTYIDQDWS